MLFKLKKLLKEYQEAGWIGKVLISKELEEVSDEDFNYRNHYEIIIYPSRNPRPKHNFMRKTYSQPIIDSETLLRVSSTEINMKMNYIVWCLGDTVLIYPINFYGRAIIDKDWIVFGAEYE